MNTVHLDEHPNITIASFELADELLGSTVGGQFQHVISINNPGESPPRPLRDHPGRHLVLYFHDITDPASYGGLVPPSTEDMRKILKFAEGIKGGQDVLVHCAAGISRSSAAALAILASKLEPSSESAFQAIQEIMQAKKIVHPNQNMVVDADKLLGYGGALIAAYRSVFSDGPLIWMPFELMSLEPFGK